jgi:hypothetical protein
MRWLRLLPLVLVPLSTATVYAAQLALSSQAFTPYQTCTVTATPSTTTNEIDAYVRQDQAANNFGAAATLSVESSALANRRTYLQFLLSACPRAIPSGATVRLATLRLYATALPAACRTQDVFAVGSAWTETGVTWNNQPFGTAINNPPTASRTASFNVGTPAGCQFPNANTYVSATVTSDVQAFVNGGKTNLGWMIRDDGEGSAITYVVTYTAKNGGTLAQAPQLVITYVDVP